MLAFSIDYYGIFFRATQSVELFCTYDEGTGKDDQKHKIRRGAPKCNSLKVTNGYGKELMKESRIARTFNQLFFIISSLLTFFHFLLYLSKIITKDN